MSIPRTAAAALVATLGLALSGCGGSGDAADTAGSPTAGTGADFPVTVTNCGREVTLEQAPQQIIGFDGAAETAFALGISDQMVGYFGNPAEEMPADYRDQAEQVELLGGTFPAPSLDAIVAADPDLLLLYYTFDDAGVTGERLDELGIPYLLLSEGCPEATGASTMDSYYDDVRQIATATGVPDRADTLIEGWRQRIAEATAEVSGDGPSVFVQGSPGAAEVFATGGTALGNDLIQLAGGRNVFADVQDDYFAPSWEDVAAANPDVIVDGSGGGEESVAEIRSYLRGNAALAEIRAVQDDAFLAVSYEQNVPGPRAIDGVVAMAEFFAQPAG